MHKKMLYVMIRCGGCRTGRRKRKPKTSSGWASAIAVLARGSWGHLLHTHSHGQLLPSDRGEKIADRQLIGGSWASSTVKDFDADSLPEVLLESNELTFTSTLKKAALCSAWTIAARTLNLANNLSRRKEAYHRFSRSRNPGW